MVVDDLTGSLDHVREVVPLFEIDGCLEVQGDQEAVLLDPCLLFVYGVACIKVSVNVGFEALNGLADLLVGLVVVSSLYLKQMA